MGKERCASHRRRQKLTLDGLQADLSLVAKKLAVLDRVADEINGIVLQTCAELDSDVRPVAQEIDRPVSPYARSMREQHALGTMRKAKGAKFEGKVGAVRSTGGGIDRIKGA